MITVSVSQKGLRVDTLQNIVNEAIRKKYPDAVVSVLRSDPPESRADRFVEAQSLVSDGKAGAEALRDELQGWRDTLPENMQGSGKADDLDNAISSLEDFINSCEEAESCSVDFPGMY